MPSPTSPTISTGQRCCGPCLYSASLFVLGNYGAATTNFRRILAVLPFLSKRKRKRSDNCRNERIFRILIVQFLGQFLTAILTYKVHLICKNVDMINMHLRSLSIILFFHQFGLGVLPHSRSPLDKTLDRLIVAILFSWRKSMQNSPQKDCGPEAC